MYTNVLLKLSVGAVVFGFMFSLAVAGALAG